MLTFLSRARSCGGLDRSRSPTIPILVLNRAFVGQCDGHGRLGRRNGGQTVGIVHGDPSANTRVIRKTTDAALRKQIEGHPEMTRWRALGLNGERVSGPKGPRLPAPSPRPDPAVRGKEVRPDLSCRALFWGSEVDVRIAVRARISSSMRIAMSARLDCHVHGPAAASQSSGHMEDVICLGP